MVEGPMAGPMVENPYRVRSTSMPARSHPLSRRVEKELSSLKEWAALVLPPTSSPPTAEVVAAGLASTANLYGCLDELLALPQVRRAVRHARGERRLAHLLESSVRLLDACSAARESLVAIREQINRVQSALRRPKCGSAADAAVDAYVRARARARKDIFGCLKGLKQTGQMSAGGAVFDEDDPNVSMVFGVLQEARDISVCFLHALLSLLSSPSTATGLLNPSRWSLVSRALLTGTKKQGATACDHDELERMDDLVYCFFRRRRVAGEELVDASMVQRHLETTESRLTSLEDAVEGTFRRLVQNRVSLLNILSSN